MPLNDTYAFELIGERRLVYTFTEGCGLIPDELRGEIFPGGQTEGNVCFEIPVTEGELLLIHQPGYTAEDRRFLWLTD